MEEIYIFGHKNPDTDSICSSMVKEILNRKDGKNNTKAYRLGNINKETEYVLNYLKIEQPELLEKVDEGQKVILVDHNSFEQSVQGIEKAKIIGVVDHHKISNFETNEPIYYTAKPYGCTATILYKEFLSKGIEIEKTEAVLMLSAIISDTLLLKSPTTTKHDKIAVENLAKIANIDINNYGLDMLKAGTDLSDFTPDELINIDSKPFTVNGVKYQAAQINTASIQDVLKDKNEIEIAVKKFMEDNNVDLFVFMITDILENNSQIIALGKTSIVEEAFNVTLKDNMAFIPGLVSRKKQVVPVIDNVINN